MGKYISNFETTAAYEAAESTLAKPHVSLTKDNMQVYYMPYVPQQPITIVYKGDNNSSTKIIVKNINAYGDVYTLDEASITKMTLDENEVSFEDFNLDENGEYDVYTYTFNDENEHTLKIWTDSTEMFRFSPWNGGPSPSQSTYFTSIKSVTIPNTITTIGNGVFRYCSGLTSCTIGSGVTSIGANAFYDCSSLTSCTIGSGVTSIGEYAFYNCNSLTSITIPSGVTSISNAFNGCSGLTSITVDSNNTVYDSRNNCNAIIETSTDTLIIGCQNTVIPNSVTSIGYSAFRECTSLTSITISDSVTSIGAYAFHSCSGLTNIDIPSGVTSIGQDAFRYCSGLTSCTIGSGVTSIGNNAFSNCSSLESATIYSVTPPTVTSSYLGGAFQNTSCPIYVPSGSVNTYKAANGWSGYASRIQAIA